MHDQAEAAVSLSLQAAQTEQARLGQYWTDVCDFLRSAKLPPAEELRIQLDSLKAEREQLLGRRAVAHQATEEKLGERLALVQARNDLAARVEVSDTRADELARTITQLSRFRVQYDRERAQLEFLSECQRLVGSLPVSRCPSCLQAIEVTRSVDSCYVCHQAMPATRSEAISIAPRMTAVARRTRDLDTYIGEVRAEQEQLKHSAATGRRELERLDATIERVASVATVPEMRRVMELDAAINSVEGAERTAEEQLQFWGQAERAHESFTAVDERIAQLRADLDRLRKNRPSRDAVIASLSEFFASILSRVRFPALRDVRVDPISYLPIVRGQVYGELSSRGAIALAVAGWHLATLEYFVENPGLFPGL